MTEFTSNDDNKDVEKGSNDKMEGRGLETGHFDFYRVNLELLSAGIYINKSNYARNLIGSYDAFDICIDDVNNRFFLDHMQQIDSMFSCFLSEIDHRRRQNSV